MGLRGWVALLMGKTVITLLRRLGRGGSTLPGLVAGRLDPGLLARLARRHRLGNLLVTGTNGKTTTARLLANILHSAGHSVASNRSGANLITGITTAFVAGAPLLNWRRPRDFGLAEVDEATMPRAAAEIGPRLAVVTNFFRDQLDRYGELQTTVNLVRKGLAAMPGATVILNADDPLAAGLGRDWPAEHVVTYGVEASGLDQGAAQAAQSADARHCVECGAPYDYSACFYAHLGHYRCPDCGQGRPRPAVALLEAAAEGDGTRVRVATPAGEFEALLPLAGLYNVYNALAAGAAAYALGIPVQVIGQGLETAVATFGRMEVIPLRGRELVVALVKNPVGFNQVLRTVLEAPGRDKQVVIAVNDNEADGTDISWLWDVDFEQLAPRQEAFSGFLATGIRGAEMALRLKYAGVPVEKIGFAGELAAAIDRSLAQTPEGGRLWLLPTYTALLHARELLYRWGAAPHYRDV